MTRTVEVTLLPKKGLDLDAFAILLADQIQKGAAACEDVPKTAAAS